MTLSKRIMEPAHPQWNEFARKLDKHLSEHVCQTLDDFSGARTILESFGETGDGGIDVEKSLEFFRYHGGFCSCQVLWNPDLNAKSREPLPSIDADLEVKP